jgi:hypothetical protein
VDVVVVQVQVPHAVLDEPGQQNQDGVGRSIR